MPGLRTSATWVCLAVAFAMVASVVAKINLELRVVPGPCATRAVRFNLYAIADSNVPQSISAMDVILAWDPNTLQFQGSDNSGPYPYNWMFSGFQNDNRLDGLNDAWADGNALYAAMAQLGGPPAYGTPTGLLVATFKFRALHVGTPAPVTMLPAFGNYSHTVVYDGFTPGLDITGTLSGTAAVPSTRGDANCDGVISYADINPFVKALDSLSRWQAEYPTCPWQNLDMSCDGVISYADINPFVALLGE
jgi:hypothetical protein